MLALVLIGGCIVGTVLLMCVWAYAMGMALGAAAGGKAV